MNFQFYKVVQTHPFVLISLQFGKVFIAVFTGFIAALIIVGGSMNNISEAPVFSITIVMLLAFAVGSAFMDVWVRIMLLELHHDY